MKSELQSTQRGSLRIDKELKHLESQHQIETKALFTFGSSRISDILKSLNRVITEYSNHKNNLDQQALLLQQNSLLLTNRVDLLDTNVCTVEEHMGYKHVYDRMDLPNETHMTCTL